MEEIAALCDPHNVIEVSRRPDGEIVSPLATPRRRWDECLEGYLLVDFYVYSVLPNRLRECM
ncbi:MAG: hypothetical protein ACI9ON_002052 [Limisphaerales bacterium]|jgi:hypothetical protein